MKVAGREANFGDLEVICVEVEVPTRSECAQVWK